MAAALKKRPQEVLSSSLCTNDINLETLVISFFSIETTADALVQAFWEPSSSLTWWAGPRTLHKRRVYRLLCATYVEIFCCKILVLAIRVHFGSYLQNYTLQICRSSSSKVVVGNGDLNSKNNFVRNMLGLVMDGHK